VIIEALVRTAMKPSAFMTTSLDGARTVTLDCQRLLCVTERGEV
jgi:hypothetical protein